MSMPTFCELPAPAMHTHTHLSHPYGASEGHFRAVSGHVYVAALVPCNHARGLDVSLQDRGMQRRDVPNVIVGVTAVVATLGVDQVVDVTLHEAQQLRHRLGVPLLRCNEQQRNPVALVVDVWIGPRGCVLPQQRGQNRGVSGYQTWQSSTINGC